MSAHERNKICQEDLINLKIKLPDDFGNEVSSDLDSKMDNMMAAISLVRAQATSNSVEILILKTENATLRREKESNLADVSIVKEEIVRLKAEVSSQQMDGKLVAVCKFKSQKSKIDILQAKKSSRIFTYNNHNIFINDHLSPFNRHLFATAAAKKRELDFKFQWTRNGSIFMREDEWSPVIKIVSEECISKLARCRDTAATIG